MQRVFVLDRNRRPLDPCHPARARQLLKARRAAIFRQRPFTIILSDRTIEESTVHPHRVKIDPGSTTTGLALVKLQIHVAPLLLGGGVRLFEHVGENVELEPSRVVESPGVTHLRYRLAKD